MNIKNIKNFDIYVRGNLLKVGEVINVGKILKTDRELNNLLKNDFIEIVTG